MKKTNINYPHPVLSVSNEDYVDSNFNIELIEEPAVEGDVLNISMRYNLQCDGMASLIVLGKAKVSLYFESVIAEYRQLEYFVADSNEITVKIKREYLNQKILVKGYITAADEINPFMLAEHNKEVFGNVPFILRKGDIMAIATHQFNIPLQSYDPLADRPSIFRIRKQTERPKEEVSTDFSDHKISIYLNEELYTKYHELYAASDIRSALTTLFAAPVLVDVLDYIKHMSEDERLEVSSLKWYQVIMHRIEELKLDNWEHEESMTKVANMILPKLFATSIDSLTKLCETVLKGRGDNET